MSTPLATTADRATIANRWTAMSKRFANAAESIASPGGSIRLPDERADLAELLALELAALGVIDFAAVGWPHRDAKTIVLSLQAKPQTNLDEAVGVLMRIAQTQLNLRPVAEKILETRNSVVRKPHAHQDPQPVPATPSRRPGAEQSRA